MRNLSVNNAIDRFGIIVVSLLVIVGIFMLSGCSSANVGDCFETGANNLYKVEYINTSKHGLTFFTKDIWDNSVDFSENEINDVEKVSCDLYASTVLEIKVEGLQDKLKRTNKYIDILDERLEKLEDRASKR